MTIPAWVPIIGAPVIVVAGYVLGGGPGALAGTVLAVVWIGLTTRVPRK